VEDLFQGRYDQKVDKKGRTSCPSAYRKLLTSESEESLVLVSAFEPCLRAYPQSSWRNFLKNLSDKSSFNPQVTMVKRAIIGSAKEVPLDKLGRVLIPGDLRDYAGIDSQAVFVGSLQYIEIWSPQNWEKEARASREKFSIQDVHKALEDLGL